MASTYRLCPVAHYSARFNRDLVSQYTERTYCSFTRALALLTLEESCAWLRGHQIRGFTTLVSEKRLHRWKAGSRARWRGRAWPLLSRCASQRAVVAETASVHAAHMLRCSPCMRCLCIRCCCADATRFSAHATPSARSSCSAPHTCEHQLQLVLLQLPSPRSMNATWLLTSCAPPHTRPPFLAQCLQLFHSILLVLGVATPWLPSPVAAVVLECVVLAMYATTDNPKLGNIILEKILGVIQKLEATREYDVNNVVRLAEGWWVIITRGVCWPGGAAASVGNSAARYVGGRKWRVRGAALLDQEVPGG